MLFPTFKKSWCKNKIPGGGGGGVEFFLFFFCRKKQFFLISRFVIFNIKTNIEKCPFTYWLNGRWFLQIVDRTVGIYIHYILYSLVLILHLKCGGGLGGGG